MATTYLELTNRVLRRLNEVTIDSADFLTVRGIQAAAKDAVLDAIREINAQKFEWPFNATSGSQLLIVGQEEYSWPIDFKMVDWESFYIEKDTSIGVDNNRRLEVLNKDEWYKQYRTDDLDSTTDGVELPRYVFESNNGGFGVTPSPDEAYTVHFNYWEKHTDLSAHGDTSEIPTEFDYVITYGALMHMFIFLDNDERAAKYEQNFSKGIADMAFILIPKDKYIYDTRVRR
jgi:hypothetical protein